MVFLLYFLHGKKKIIHILSDIRPSLCLPIQQSRIEDKVSSELQTMTLCKIAAPW